MQKIIVTRNTETGTFIFCDAEFLESYSGKPKGVIKIPIGSYDAVIDISSTGGWFSDIGKKRGLLKIYSGRMYAGDPGAAFTGKLWDNFINGTNYGKTVPLGVIVVDTGGDGIGKIELSLKKRPVINLRRVTNKKKV